jgi:hypothetical protein
MRGHMNAKEVPFIYAKQQPEHTASFIEVWGRAALVTLFELRPNLSANYNVEAALSLQNMLPEA